VKGRDPHTVVATAASVVIKRVTSQLDKDVGKKNNKRSFDIGRNGSTGSLRESSPRISSRNSFTNSQVKYVYYYSFTYAKC
jgi:hypothetical protein